MLLDQTKMVSSCGHLDMRDAFFDEVVQSAMEDRRIVVLTDDQGAFSLERLRRERPDQYINLGIAEQNAIDLAAGMALGGIHPYVYGITNFVSLRCAEQISVNLSLMRLPVTIVASGGGLTYASDGPTHHATQDIGVLRMMPYVSIYNPCDAISTASVARASLRAEGPFYVRIEKGTLPNIFPETHRIDDGFALLRRGGDLLIVSSGIMSHRALEVAKCLEGQGISAGVLDLYRLKPIGVQALGLELGSTQGIAVIEEHAPTGGAFTIVAEVLAEMGRPKPVRRFTLADVPCYRYGSREWLHCELSLSTTSVSESLYNWVTGDLRG